MSAVGPEVALAKYLGPVESGGPPEEKMFATFFADHAKGFTHVWIRPDPLLLADPERVIPRREKFAPGQLLYVEPRHLETCPDIAELTQAALIALRKVHLNPPKIFRQRSPAEYASPYFVHLDADFEWRGAKLRAVFEGCAACSVRISAQGQL